MKIAIYFSAICLTASLAFAYHDEGYDEGYDADYHRPDPLESLGRRLDIATARGRTLNINHPVPTKFGIVVYPGFQALDVFGPLEVFNALSETVKMELSIISKTWEPVSTKGPEMKNIYSAGSNFSQQVWPTETFGSTSKALEVLIVPGGIGAFKIEQAYIDFIKGAHPKLRYLITVGTGSGIVARTGVLDGKKVTSSKAIWRWSVQQGLKVLWQRDARWAVDGNIWSSSGRAAGMDMTFAFVNEIFGGMNSTNVANLLEYPRHRRASWDLYSKIWETTKSNSSMTDEDKMRNNFL